MARIIGEVTHAVINGVDLTPFVKQKRPNDRRGTSNKNVSGSSYARRARKAWMLETFAADVFLVHDEFSNRREVPVSALDVYGDDAILCCRCYRCGKLLTAETVEADRIIPGCLGGTYRRNNIRPACGPCNRITGNQAKALKAKRGKR